MSPRDDQRRLQDMQEAIERIERYANEGRDTFATNELVQTWVIHHLAKISPTEKN